MAFSSVIARRILPSRNPLARLSSLFATENPLQCRVYWHKTPEIRRLGRALRVAIWIPVAAGPPPNLKVPVSCVFTEQRAAGARPRNRSASCPTATLELRRI
jgi:hypothetical protein